MNICVVTGLHLLPIQPLKTFVKMRNQGFVLHRAYNWLCEPSQSGALLLCLQVHQAMRLASVTSFLIGVKSVPLWEPSQ